jgi:hypothetical protein
MLPAACAALGMHAAQQQLQGCHAGGCYIMDLGSFLDQSWLNHDPIKFES